MEKNTTDKKKPQPTTKAWPLIKRFWPWARPHRKFVWLTAALLLISTPLSLVSPLIVRRVVDDAEKHSSPDDVIFWGLVLVGMTFLSVVFGLAIGYSTTLFHTKVLRDIRLDLYTHMQKLSLRYYSNKETGYLMSRQVDDVGNLNGVMADTFATAGSDVIRGIGYVVMVFYIEWRMATVGLVLVVLIFGFQFAISGRLRMLGKAARESWTKVSEVLHQGLSGYALVQATASEKREARRFTGVLHTSVRAQLKRDLFSLWTNQAFGLIGGVGPTVIVLAGVYLIVTSDFTTGGLFAFFMYLVSMFGAVGSITSLNPRLQSSIASLERIYEILDVEPEVASPPQGIVLSRPEGAIRFENISFSYEPDRPVLTQINLEIPPRTRVALVGPSGAGKTTLAQLVPRFYDPKTGRILIDDQDLRTLDVRSYRAHVGLVPQEIFLFDRNVAENISYGSPRATREEIRDAARAANAHDFIEEMSEGFDTLIGERGVKLSGGQRQRLAIAREILRNPSVLILDEATSSLDSGTEALIQQAMNTLLQGRTSLVIAHRLSTIVKSDLIVVLEKGRIIEKGTHEFLLEQDGLYSKLYRTQFGETDGD